jgi:hypothetical protein
VRPAPTASVSQARNVNLSIGIIRVAASSARPNAMIPGISRPIRATGQNWK